MKLNLLQVNPPSNEQQQCIAINQLINGGSNAIGTITLRASQTTTSLQNNLLTANSVVLLTPQTAHAATVTGIWVDPTSFTPQAGNTPGGTVTINHSSVAQNDLTFGYEVRN